MSRLFFLVIAVFVGCTPMQRRIMRAQDVLQLTDIAQQTQTIKLDMCEERKKHAQSCKAQCEIAAKWHKKEWN